MGLAGKVQHSLRHYHKSVLTENHFNQGLLHLKERQDTELPAAEHYIRYAPDVPFLSSVIHNEDDIDSAAGDPIRIIICMSKASSARLLEAQFLQSDIGFKHIVGFQEFELGGRDYGSRTGMLNLLYQKCLR